MECFCYFFYKNTFTAFPRHFFSVDTFRILQKVFFWNNFQSTVPLKITSIRKLFLLCLYLVNPLTWKFVTLLLILLLIVFSALQVVTKNCSELASVKSKLFNIFLVLFEDWKLAPDPIWSREKGYLNKKMALGASCQKLSWRIVSGRRGAKFLRGTSKFFQIDYIYCYCLIAVTFQV